MREAELKFNNPTEILANKLEGLEKTVETGSEGIPPVKTIIAYLRRGKLENAKAVCLYDGDKISYYPDIVNFLRTELFANGTDPETPPHFRI